MVPSLISTRAATWLYIYVLTRQIRLESIRSVRVVFSGKVDHSPSKNLFQSELVLARFVPSCFFAAFKCLYCFSYLIPQVCYIGSPGRALPQVSLMSSSDNLPQRQDQSRCIPKQHPAPRVTKDRLFHSFSSSHSSNSQTPCPSGGPQSQHQPRRFDSKRYTRRLGEVSHHNGDSDNRRCHRGGIVEPNQEKNILAVADQTASALLVHPNQTRQHGTIKGSFPFCDFKEPQPSLKQNGCSSSLYPTPTLPSSKTSLSQSTFTSNTPITKSRFSHRRGFATPASLHDNFLDPLLLDTNVSILFHIRRTFLAPKQSEAISGNPSHLGAFHHVIEWLFPKLDKLDPEIRSALNQAFQSRALAPDVVNGGLRLKGEGRHQSREGARKMAYRAIMKELGSPTLKELNEAYINLLAIEKGKRGLTLEEKHFPQNCRGHYGCRISCKGSALEVPVGH